jgi:hypothetical protein
LIGLERGDSSEEEVRDLANEKSFLRAIYPRVAESLIHYLLNTFTTFLEVNDVLG